MKDSKDIYDVIIIGGGPSGYTAALYCARAALDTLIIEEFAAGGQMAYAEHIDNYPGFDDGIIGFDLAQKMQKGAEKFGAKTMHAKVQSLELSRKEKIVRTTQGDLKCKVVILSMGAAPRTLGLDGEKELRGSGLSYCATCDGAFFKGKTVAVIGGGNSAVHEAISLSALCTKVFLIHHGKELKAEKAAIKAIDEANNISQLYNTDVVRLISSNGLISGLELLDKPTGKKEILNCEGIFVAIGRIPNTDICPNEIAKDPQGYIIAGESTETTVEGVFAIGDLRTKPLRQIITAAADGAVAAMNAEKYIKGVI